MTPDTGESMLKTADCDDPDAGAREGVRMRLAASLDHMHLIDDASGCVL